MKTNKAIVAIPGKLVGLVMLVFLFVFPACQLEAQTDYLVIDVDDLFGLWYSESDWGDMDADHDLDLIMVGYGAGGQTGQGFMKFYRNDGNSDFALVDNPMLGTGNGSVRFADLDNDNDLDAIVCGQVASNVDSTRVYINNAGVFTDCGFNFPPRVSSSISIADYDCDGDADILLTGGTIDDGTTGYIQIFRNEGNFNFTQIDAFTPGIRNGNAEFGDYDGDGWPDIAFTGSAGSGNYVSKILHNNTDGTFTENPAVLAGLRYSRISWVDYNCDGTLDIILSGSFSNEEPSVFKLYSNDGNGVFTDTAQPNVLGERQGDIAWGDINNDGYPDIIVNGLITTNTYVEKLYIYNPQNGLYEDGQSLTYLKYAAVTLGDYNNDAKLDMSVSGLYSSGNYWNELYINTVGTANTPPSPPQNLESVVVDNQASLSWDTATDAETPAAGLTYNLRVGTTSGGTDIVSPLAETGTGWRKVARPGNAWLNGHYLLRNLPDGTYYWSVQAIDNSFAGSGFAAEQTFIVGEVSTQDQVMPVLADLACYPNPFRGETRLGLRLMAPSNVVVEVFNLKGQLVATLAETALAAGQHSFAWNGTDSRGQDLPSGVYSLRVTTGREVVTRKIALLK
jgi:hypothetical protein